MGTSGRCGKFLLEDVPGSEKVDFDKKEMQNIYDELNTSDKGDIVTLGSPQLGLEEIADLSSMLKGRSFKKRCMVFCPRAVRDQARKLGYIHKLEQAGCEILTDCCTCLTPLVCPGDIDSVTTNSIKGAYYLKNSNKVNVNLKPLSKIIQEETK
jgi:predicted aconitase